MTISYEGTVASVSTILSAAVLSLFPKKVNGGETWKMELSYIVLPVMLVGGVDASANACGIYCYTTHSSSVVDEYEGCLNKLY